MTSAATTASTFRLTDAWFICDRCSQRWRRSRMNTEWDNLKVCMPCLDPRPPQMSPPDIYPEGLPFVDARPPNDFGDALQDDTYLVAIGGGVTITNGQGPPVYPTGQGSPPGALAPQDVLETPQPPPSPAVLQDDRIIRTGPVFAR